MDDIVLVTADSVRLDYADSLPFLSSFRSMTGITIGNYTRPSLAGILTSNYQSAIETRVVGPTIADVLSGVGYTCIGLSPTPNTDAQFGFDSGFDYFETFVSPGREGSKWRQYLSKFDLLKHIYYRVFPPQAKSANRPSDREVIDKAIEQFNSSESPRFLWVHLMESHRPYGSGEDAVPQRTDRRAVISPEKLSEDERQLIDEKYRHSLKRVDENVRRLLSELDSDPVFVFSSDHGEGFGDEGFYFHQGHKRSVGDYLIQVPLVVKGIEIDEEALSHIDLAPTLARRGGAEIPKAWQGRDATQARTDHAITIAPWHEYASIAWQDFDTKIVAADADVSMKSADSEAKVQTTEVPDDLEGQLQDLGYLDAG